MPIFSTFGTVKQFSDQQTDYVLTFGKCLYITKMGKARVMLHIGVGHSNNCQIILKLYQYDIFCNNLQHTKKFQTNLEVSEVLISYITNRGKAMVMLHVGAGHSNNCQIVLKLFGYDIFCNNLQHKKIK